MAFTNAEDVTKYIKDNDVEFVDIRFTDVPGVEQHFTIPADAFDEDVINEGLASMVRPSEGSPLSTNPTWLSCQTWRRPSSIRFARRRR